MARRGKAWNGETRTGEAWRGLARLTHWLSNSQQLSVKHRTQMNALEIQLAQDPLVKLPLWKRALEEMIRDGLNYGKSWPVEFYERHFRCNRHERAFGWEMMDLRQCLERDHGYYLRSEENGRLYTIPEAAAHEDVAKSFERRHRRFLRRSFDIRVSTLSNPLAKLEASERNEMNGNMERAAVRLILMDREKSVLDCIKQHAPQILHRKQS